MKTSWQQQERARDTLAREVGFVRKPHVDRIRVVLSFPNTYYVGMSNLGLQTVYRLFNELDDVVCERCFLPPRSEREGRTEPLITLESQSLVSDFDVLAFSVSFEWDYVNILSMLRMAGMPRYASERSARHPLVVIGGAVTFVNPEPLAPFADVIAAGEGEVLVPALAEALRSSSDRTDVLRSLSRRVGFYVPSLYDVHYGSHGTIEGFESRHADTPPSVRKASVMSTTQLEPPSTSIFTPDTEFGSRLLIEVVRGCAKLCRFCWAGYNYLPVRSFPADRILEIAKAAQPHANRCGLVSIALCDHPDIEGIMTGLIGLGYSISPASLRLDDLTPNIVRYLHESGERTVTIAPETGSDRLRRVINKTVTNEQILERAELIFASGIENLKLYFMIGLPTETDDDLMAIRELTEKIRAIMLKHARPRGRIGRIIGSVNPLVPKPATTYQWLPMEAPSTIDKKVKRLRRLLRGLDNVYFSIKSERHSFYQALQSLGDRRVAPAIVAAEENGGNWREAVASTGCDADFFVLRDRSKDRVLPWDIIDGGLKASFFRTEFEKGLREELTLSTTQLQRVQPVAPV